MAQPSHSDTSSPAFTVSLALAAGIVCQGLAHHLRIPGIVLLLGAGAVLGPDVLNVVRPEVLGDTLQTLVGFAVAVILFEGGMNLNVARLKRESDALRRLVTVGALVTAAGGALAARLFLDLDWSLAILFGTLVIVTGPTVVTPLLRRFRLKGKVSTVLEAEGVLIDPIGAIIAVVALEVAIQPSTRSFMTGLLEILARLGLGAGLGLAGGYAIARLLRPRWLVPEGLENVFALAMVWALFVVSNTVEPESGIATVTVAGMVVGNVRSRATTDLREFKEQLTVLLIGMLFVLLSADVRFEEVRSLGWAGVLTVAALMFVVRPLNVLASTVGTDLTLRERLFLCWMAPRGIVAAAVASFFAVALDGAGIEGGSQLRALVFLVIAVTVTAQGMTGGVVAGWLGLRRTVNQGFVILGASGLGRALAAALREGDQEAILVDSNADAVAASQTEGFRVLFGNALEERLLARAQMDTRVAAVAITPNESVNLQFAERTRESGVPRVYVALNRSGGHVTDDMVERSGARVLFGVRRDIDLWRVRIRQGTAFRQRWRYVREQESSLYGDPHKLTDEEKLMLPLVRYRKGKVSLLEETTTFQQGDELSLLWFKDHGDRTEAWLGELGWEPVAEPAPPTKSLSEVAAAGDA